MFYSHEVLTSRKYGVATVWLMATLGSKSSLKKVNRKAILSVDVAKACHTISAPEAPMALRLQSNLLYGVSRVFLQQCGYVLTDAQNAQNAMKAMFKIVKDSELDPEAGRVRPDQLVLEDDPTFLPEFLLPPPDLSLSGVNLGGPAGEAQGSLLFTPYGSQDLSGSQGIGGPVGGLVIPSSRSASGGFDDGEYFIQGDDGRGTSQQLDQLDEPLVEADFAFDADGNIIDLTPTNPIGEKHTGTTRPAIGSDTGASARVRQEHQEGQRIGNEFGGEAMDLDMPMLGDDFNIIPEGEAFPLGAGNGMSSSQAGDPGSSSTAAASMRRTKIRGPRIIPLDEMMELHNTDLMAWNKQYLQNMSDATRHKLNLKAAAQGKKNAEFWIWGSGIGNIGQRLGGAPSPLDMFHGDSLFEAVTGMTRESMAGLKRDRDSGIDEETESQARRVRPRSDDDELNRGDMDEGIMFMGDDTDIPRDDVEMPRDAPSALDEAQLLSAMPWNITASIRGSSAMRGSSLARARLLQSGVPTSIGGPGSIGMLRGSRMVSASPLHGRGQPGGLDALRSFEGEDEYGFFGGDDFGDASSPGGKGLTSPGGPAGVKSQVNQKVLDALDAEGVNFLAFVEDRIQEKRTRLQEHLADEELQSDAAADMDEVTFEELLPPKENWRVTAAKALMHTLALATKGLLEVRQEEAFGEIGLRVVQFDAQDAADDDEDEGDADEEALELVE
ncbi:uncharacterized protein BDZ99DRAFT_443330 [Mytilinidion resinicola]|uniref:Rad21/Rec8-like protein N-terminal domain-containing protein n=1 Tax=Mytilinidion resinicola TaxID=574789 RepID=A0A6A6YNQ5_9PEZI|nr:uncharacterized protein BDZ99DRAFT_443330 [Mytilinidion resinicola]KAF2810502.1 hypothetical protein BDZ99DRAFT_443330 [Mytilinidion resinicola]